jgi:hypothetical protein
MGRADAQFPGKSERDDSVGEITKSKRNAVRMVSISSTLLTDPSNIAIHPVANYVLVKPFFEPREIGSMAPIEVIGTFEKSKVIGNAFFLDIRVSSTPFDIRRRKVRCGGTKATEAACIWKTTLQACEIGGVEDEAFQHDPAARKADLNPTVDDPLGRQPIGQSGDGALVKRLVDSEAVEAARNADRT